MVSELQLLKRIYSTLGQIEQSDQHEHRQALLASTRQVVSELVWRHAGEFEQSHYNKGQTLVALGLQVFTDLGVESTSFRQRLEALPVVQHSFCNFVTLTATPQLLYIIRERFAIDMSLSSVGKLLRRLGSSLQKRARIEFSTLTLNSG